MQPQKKKEKTKMKIGIHYNVQCSHLINVSGVYRMSYMSAFYYGVFFQHIHTIYTLDLIASDFHRNCLAVAPDKPVENAK